ncbi:hypothetical protein MMC28_007446 [Mycoblastus sanguinarius]|nr:hypothetical protein [Mycoblastus sanguinarius]
MPDWDASLNFDYWINMPPENVVGGDEFRFSSVEALNGGRHMALNQDYDKASTQWDLAVPSDDYANWPTTTIPGLQHMEQQDHFNTVFANDDFTYDTNYQRSFVDLTQGSKTESCGNKRIPIECDGIIITNGSGLPKPAQAARVTDSNATLLNPYHPSSDEPSHECSCVSCLSVGVTQDWREGMCCRFPGCVYSTNIHSDHITHEREHFHEPSDTLVHCVEHHCHFTTKRWPDPLRHYTVRHCTSPQKLQYACPVPWCKYSGTRGFARKDKLKSHYKNMHEGKNTLATPNRDLRAIMPAISKGSAAGLDREILKPE